MSFEKILDHTIAMPQRRTRVDCAADPLLTQKEYRYLAFPTSEFGVCSCGFVIYPP
jgi:hypothetical protein